MNRCAALLFLFLAACGQSGPLYLPEDPAEPVPAASPDDPPTELEEGDDADDNEASE